MAVGRLVGRKCLQMMGRGLTPLYLNSLTRLYFSFCTNGLASDFIAVVM